MNTVPSPYVTAHFTLEIDGITGINFSKCAGLTTEVGIEEFTEGGENRFTYRFPVRTSFPNLVLTRGAGPARDLWDWFYEYYLTGVVAPREGQITLMATVDGGFSAARVWSFTRGWPVKLTGSELDAQTNAIAVESLEIAHHGLRLARVGV